MVTAHFGPRLDGSPSPDHRAMAALSRLLLIVLRDGSIDRHHQQDMVRERRECKSVRQSPGAPSKINGKFKPFRRRDTSQPQH
jgi:hypothetical protein